LNTEPARFRLGLPLANLAGFFIGGPMTIVVDLLFVAAAGAIVLFAIASLLSFVRR
jgi:hypothetical protein